MIDIPKERIQPFIEFWLKTPCPKCDKTNWCYQTHSQRSLDTDVRGIECWNCHNKFYLGYEEDFKDEFYTELEEYPIDDVFSDYLSYDTGKRSPRE